MQMSAVANQSQGYTSYADWLRRNFKEAFRTDYKKQLQRAVAEKVKNENTNATIANADELGSRLTLSDL